ncbi:MAG: peptidoglycan-binding protein, partial [Hyphomicrobiaceae bacterium]
MSSKERLDLDSIRIGAVGLIVACVTAAPVHARDSDAMSWIRFGGQSHEASTQSYNQSFVRQWEANPPRGYPTISRSNIGPTKAAIKRYKVIVKRGGWRTIGKLPEDEKTLEVGLSHDLVGQLHDRLLFSGELRNPSNFPRYFDYTLEKAVKRFQASNGLTPTGIVDDRTRRALNIPAKVRLRQLRVNLNRLRAHAKKGKRRYVVVNIPAAQIESVENDRVVSRHT